MRFGGRMMQQHIGRAGGVIVAPLCAFIMAANVTVVTAQAPVHSTAWFGVALPGPAGDPHRSVVDLTRAAATPLRLPPGETPEPEFTGARIRQDIEAIIAFARQSHSAGDKVWGRVT